MNYKTLLFVAFETDVILVRLSVSKVGAFAIPTSNHW